MAPWGSPQLGPDAGLRFGPSVVSPGLEPAGMRRHLQKQQQPESQNLGSSRRLTPAWAWQSCLMSSSRRTTC